MNRRDPTEAEAHSAAAAECSERPRRAPASRRRASAEQSAHTKGIGHADVDTPSAPRPPARAPTSTSDTRIQQVYDRYAAVYDWLFGPVLDPGRRRLAHRASAVARTRILEIGVGTGLTLGLYDPRLAVVGIDLSWSMLAKARDRIRNRARPGAALPPTSLAQMNAERLALADASFDCIVLPYVLTTVSNPERLLDEAARVAAPGARILVLNHFAGSRFWRAGEALTAGLRDRLGFDTGLTVEAALDHPALIVRSVETVNLLGLSKLVELERR